MTLLQERRSSGLVSAAQQLVADLGAFESSAHQVEGGQQPPDRLLLHIGVIGARFSELVDQVGALVAEEDSPSP